VRILKIFLLLFLLGIIISSIYFLPKVIKINLIDCESQYGPCNKVLVDRVDAVDPGRFIDVRGDLEGILNNNIFVKEYTIAYGYPDELKVFLVEEKPVYALKDKSNKASLISREGYVLTRSDSTNLPTLFLPGQHPQVGKKVKEGEHFALEIIYDIYPLYQVKRSEIANLSLHVFFEDGLEIIFPLEGDKEVLLGSLNLILARLRGVEEEPRIEGVNDVEIIDLRFNNPVLRLSNNYGKN